MEWCVFYACMGILVGLFYAFWFTRTSDDIHPDAAKKWFIPVTLGILGLANVYCGLGIDDFLLPSTVYLVFFLCTFVAVFGAILKYINTKYTEGKSHIRIMDVITGSTKLIEEYYRGRTKEIDTYLRIEEYAQSKKESLEAKKKAEYALKKLKEKEAAYIQQTSAAKGIVFEYPIDQEYPVTQGFVKSLPGYAANYAAFQHAIIGLTESIPPKKRKKSSALSDAEGVKMWEGFFFGLCHLINTTLFDTRKEMVRSHVRILHNGYYQKVVAVTGDSKYEYSLKPIPQNSGMIKAAYDHRTSLVKSLNIANHYKGNNDLTWKDYLTFAVPGHEENGSPLVSIGISIANEEQYGELLYLLNYLRIEKMICEQIERLSKVFALEAYIEKWRESNGTL